MTTNTRAPKPVSRPKPTSKRKINWYFAAVGVFFLVGGFSLPTDDMDAADLTTKTITLSRNSEYSKSRWRGSGVYELRAREAKAVFIIDVAGRRAAKDESLDNLHAGDTLQVGYFRGQETVLGDPSREIRVYSLQKTGRVYFDVAAYNLAERKYRGRLAWFAWVGGVLLLLNGLTFLNDKTTYGLAAVGFVILILLRMMGLFLY